MSAAWFAGCGAPDPGEVGPDPSGKKRTRTDGGVIPGPQVDGGTQEDSGQPVDTTAFTGAAAFQAGRTGATTDNAKHGANLTPAGQECLTCHIAGGEAAARPYSAGGTVYTTRAATTPVDAGVEIRIRAADGGAYSAYTDKNGAFFIPEANYTIPANSQIGVRDAAKTKPMVQKMQIGDGSCGKGGNCHNAGAGAQPKVYLE